MITKENIEEAALKLLPGFKMALVSERENILNRWLKYGMDREQGGFYEIISTDNKPDLHVPKSAATTAAVLYIFSKSYSQTGDAAQLAMADRAANYLKNFRDHTHGGVFNTLKGNTEPEDTDKHTRTQATVLNALCAYYACNKIQAAKDLAIALYRRIIQKSKDEKYGGFLESFNREWEPLRIENDAEKNGYTQVLVLTALTDLYSIWPDKELEHEIVDLIELLNKKIIRENYFYLHVECKKDWTPISNYVLFGYDLEAARALYSAANALPDAELAEMINYTCIKLCHTSTMGLDKDGGIWKQYFFEGHTVVKVKEGWAQAAAMLSFLTAWRLSEDDKFLQQAMHSYHFVHKRIIDAESGSWLPAVDTEYKSLEVKDQEILTKYPMHNFRALNETIQLIDLYLE